MKNKPFSIVGIGASAGGLTALRGFFAAMPSDSGISFVVVMHLSPAHESSLAELIQASTAIPVTQVTGRVEMAPDHVYVIPPGKRLLVNGNTLELADLRLPDGPRLQIDLFFRLLAEARRDGAAIILSGTGSDGAIGIQAIKEQGGLILAQSPDEAEYDSMPRNAIATGLVDTVGPVAELAQRLVAAKQIQIVYQMPEDAAGPSQENQNTLSHILNELRNRTGHDFSDYKHPTILRRIARRMTRTRQRTLSGYLQYLRQHDDEAHRLFHDLLISVTQFFRDPDAWAALSQTVIPELFAKKDHRNTVRVWSAACATGEEAYSLAILLLEQATLLNFPGTIQIFASDVSQEALDYARAGVYPATIAADLSAERLARFFTPEEGHYRVRDNLREVVLFTQHNLLEDPPFSRVELVSCRNLLIYLQREMQVTIYDTFHHALLPNGYLFLGSSESIDEMTEHFQTLDKRHRAAIKASPRRRCAPQSPAVPSPRPQICTGKAWKNLGHRVSW